MKVKEMMEQLSKLPPNESICVVWWQRPRKENLGGYISAEDWRTICEEFDDYISYDGSNLDEWIQQAITDYMKPIEQ